MAMSTMDNESAKLAIALQLHDLDELEAQGTVDKLVIRIQRQQLEVDSGFDAVTFEASRRLALSMAKAVEDDSVLLNQLTRSPQIDKATFDRLALLNNPTPISSSLVKPVPQLTCTERTLPSTARTLKRARSPTPEDEPSPASVNTNDAKLNHQPHTAVDHTKHPHKKVRTQQVISDQDSRLHSTQDLHPSTADLGNQEVKATAATTVIETPPSTADCASCSDHSTTDNLVKAACEHYYCKDCFGQFVEASLQTHDGFPPKCCKIPIPFVTIAANVSAPVYNRYSARQAEIKNAAAIYCGVQRCGVKIENDRIQGVRATCVACWRDTCTLCRGEFPKRVNGRNVGHACKKDKAREKVLALARRKGWQMCYQCGNLVALNNGCHHMTCRCEAEFCYRCGTKWRNCECGDYDEPRLGHRAARGVRIRAARRAARNLSPDPRPRRQQVAELRQRLRVNCDHNNFHYEGGKSEENPGYCQICEYEGWKYIYRCGTCGFTACNWCHNYRNWNRDDNPWRGSTDEETDQEIDQETDLETDQETDDEPASEYEST